jgi:hypothetical protein
MVMTVVSVDLPHPVGEVWSALARLERHSEWMSDAEQIDFESDRRGGVGTRMVVRTRVGPIVTKDVIEVWDWTVGESIGVTHHGLVSGIGFFVLVPTTIGTRFVWWEDLAFPWYLGGALTAWFAGPVLSRMWRANLNRFAASLH